MDHSGCLCSTLLHFPSSYAVVSTERCPVCESRDTVPREKKREMRSEAAYAQTAASGIGRSTSSSASSSSSSTSGTARANQMPREEVIMRGGQGQAPGARRVGWQDRFARIMEGPARVFVGSVTPSHYDLLGFRTF
jgi:hypothetical protein